MKEHYCDHIVFIIYVYIFFFTFKYVYISVNRQCMITVERYLQSYSSGNLNSFLLNYFVLLLFINITVAIVIIIFLIDVFHPCESLKSRNVLEFVFDRRSFE